MSYTFTLSGRTAANLSARIHPPIVLNDSEQFDLGLINFETYNSIPNIDSSNNTFHYGIDGKSSIKFPEGSYEIKDINDYLNAYARDNNKEDDLKISILANHNTLQCEVLCNKDIHFDKKNSIGSLLGFKSQQLEANKKHVSENPVDIFKVNAICIECNLVINSYNNGDPVHILHMFYPTSPPGFKIVEKPSNVIYLPISTRYIDEILLKITDQSGEAINFRSELITVRLHLRKA